MFYGIFSRSTLLTIQNFCVPLQRKSRDGAVVARWAHNPKVVSSSLAPATKQKAESLKVQLFLFPNPLHFHGGLIDSPGIVIRDFSITL